MVYPFTESEFSKAGMLPPQRTLAIHSGEGVKRARERVIIVGNVRKILQHGKRSLIRDLVFWLKERYGMSYYWEERTWKSTLSLSDFIS